MSENILKAAVRETLIEGLVDSVDELPQYRMAVILQLLARDSITRAMLAENFGERAIALHKEGVTDTSWDEIMGETLLELSATPGGKGTAPQDV